MAFGAVVESNPLVDHPLVVDICISRWAGSLQFHPQRMASFGMKAYRSRLARVQDPARNLPPRPAMPCPGSLALRR